MELEGGKIGSFSFFILTMGFTFGSSVIITPGKGAGHDAWVTVLAGLMEGVFFAYIFFTLAGKFPGKNLVEINKHLYGTYLGNLISFLYLGYFLHLGSLVLRNFGDFFNVTVYPQTPMVVLLGLTVLISASAVRNGIEVISRCSLVLVPLILLDYFFMTVFLLPRWEIARLQPFMELSIKDFVKISHDVASFPFGETVALLMITGYIHKKSASLKKAALPGIIITGIILTIVTIRNTGVFGSIMSESLYPSFDAVQLIDIGDILTRLEIIIILSLYSMGFIKLSVLYYGVALGTAQILQLRSYLPLVLPIGIIMTVLSLTQFENAIENITWASQVYPFYSLPFQFFLPLLSLALATIKNKKGSHKGGGKT